LNVIEITTSQHIERTFRVIQEAVYACCKYTSEYYTHLNTEPINRCLRQLKHLNKYIGEW